MSKIILFLLLWITAYSSKASNFHSTNVPGPYSVGFRVVRQYDLAHVYKQKIDLTRGTPVPGERARPLQTLIWYPAMRTSGKQLHYGEYVRLAATETEFTRSNPEVEQFVTAALTEQYANLTIEQRRCEMGQTMLAMRDVEEVPNKFPVIIYAPGSSSSAHENADLCEYLASHGYIVIASASIGVNTRGMSLDLEGAEAQAGDITFLVGYAATIKQANSSKIAVIGYSFGGLANVLAAAHDDRISALVALDGSVRYYPSIAQAAAYATPERLALPMLYLGSKPSTTEAMNRNQQISAYSLLNQMKYSDLYNVTMYTMEHAAFQSESLRLGDEQLFGEYTRDEATLAYGWMEKYVLTFLNAYLKEDTLALRFMNSAPKSIGVPSHLLSIDVHRADGKPPTLTTLATEFATHNFVSVAEIYREMKKNSPTFKPSERALISWGEPFLDEKRYRQAIEIYELVNTLYPDSPRAAYYLALAYDRHKDSAHAIENYKRVLNFWPDMSEAKQSIIRLSH